MVYTPTTTLTGTYVLWIDASGNDVGGWAISVFQGFQVITFILVIILGLWTALKVLP